MICKQSRGIIHTDGSNISNELDQYR